MNGGSCLGYGWPATLELLSPPIGKPVDSRQTIKMNICPACRCVHEDGGSCISRHVGMAALVLDTPATAIGNSNPLELHSRTIQQLIAANLTLAAAWTWIQELMTANDTGRITSFPLVVTSEVYTIGFDSALMNALPNMTVENSGNSSLPPPPVRQTSFWEAAWNSFTGLVSAVWNAVVAVATFIANVALAVFRWCIDFAVAVASGQGLQFFYDTVVKPFVDALLAFIKWIIDFIIAMVKWIFSPLINAFNEMVSKVKAAAAYAIDPPPLTAVLTAFWDAVLLSAFGIFLVSAFIALTIVMKIVNSIPGGGFIAIVIGVLTGIFVGIQLVNTLFGAKTSDLIPDGIDGVIDVSFTFAEFLLGLSIALAAITRVWETIDEAVANLCLATLSLIILAISLSLNHDSLVEMGKVFILDLFAVGLAFGGDLLGWDYEFKPGVGAGSHYSLLAPVANALSTADKFMSVSSTIADAAQVERLAGG